MRQLICPTFDMGIMTRGVRVTQAGWKADPLRRHSLRYWDGSGWTGHVSDDDDPLWDDEGLSALSSASTSESGPQGPTGKVSVTAVVVAWFLTVIFGQLAIGQASALIGGSSFGWLFDLTGVVGVLVWTALFAAGAYASVRVSAQFADGDRSKLFGALATAGAVLAGYNGARLLTRAASALRHDTAYALERGVPGLLLALVAAALGWFAFRSLKGDTDSGS